MEAVRGSEEPDEIELVDFGVNLAHRRFDAYRELLMARARAAGVTRQVITGTMVGSINAAAALANARTFGGNDYEGYHTLMALVPAYQMSRELSDSHKALPI